MAKKNTKKTWSRKTPDPKFCRINPGTDKPFQQWDPRPSKNCEIVISPTSGKRMVYMDATEYVDKNGIKRTLRKRYPVDDGHVFVKYLLHPRIRNGNRILDKHGYYFEHWTPVKETTCDTCGILYKTLRINTSDNKKSRGNYCPDHQKNTMREGNFDEWKERGWAVCMRTEIISKITGCPGDHVPFENFKVVKHSVYGNDQLAGYCRKCEKVRARINHARRTFSVTPEQYYEQLKKQDFHCMICPREISFDHSALNIDHDHDYDDSDTLQFNRGFLCKSCNQLVGLRGVKEDVDRAEKLYHYLLRAELLKKKFRKHPELLEQGGFPQLKEDPID